MNAITLTLPPSLLEQARALAERDRIPLDQFVALAVAEKTSALLAADYIANRAKRASRARYEEVLDKVPDAGPDPGDLPES